MPDDDLIALDEALEKLSRLDPPIAELVKLRYFTNLTIPQAAEVLGISPRTAETFIENTPKRGSATSLGAG